MRILVQLISTLIIAAAPAMAKTHSEGEARPNVVLIYVDDLGYGDLAAYGHPVIETPVLDALADDGLRLTAFYAPSPLCSPSRAALLTGRTPYRTGIESWIPQGTNAHLSENEITIATLFKDDGYQTAIIGKWHLNGGLDRKDQTQPVDHGFDHSYVLHAFPIPHQHNPTNFHANGKPLGEVKGFTAEIVVNEAIRWLDERDKHTPVFLYLPFVEPHGTIASPESFLQKYGRYTKGDPVPVVNGASSYPDGLEARGPGEYYANVNHLDYQVGRFLAYLDDQGLRDNTILVFLSDNGPVTTDWRAWWEVNLYGDTGGYRGRKADLYEGGIRVPGIIRYPGHIKPGSVSDTAVNGYDIMPTLAALANIPMPDDRAIDGIDLSPLLNGKKLKRTRPLFWAFPADKNGPNYVILDGDWKLLADKDKQPMALYDLGSDRFEVNNLLTAKPKKAAKLYQEMLDYIQDVEADPLRPDWAVTWKPQL